MTKAIVIPAEIEIPMHVVDVTERDALGHLQQLVGGYIQVVPVEHDNVSFFANEEGKIQGLPLNERADTVWEFLLPQSYRVPGDYLVGDCVLIGCDPETGMNADVPAFLLEQLKLQD
jgi:hypothetical protein